MKNKPFLFLMVMIICTAFPILAVAQGGPPGDPVDTPFDGGLSILIAAGIGYGVKTFRENRKKNAMHPDETTDISVK